MASSVKTSTSIEAALARAAEVIRSATAIMLTSGAGMGVDSGLPDFRGPEGEPMPML